MKYPRQVYLLFPYDEFGDIAGVYVGSSHNVARRMDYHFSDRSTKFRKQRNLHKLMRDNGFSYVVVDTIENEDFSYIEYDWVDYFLQNFNVRVFNSKKIGCAIWNWHRLKNPGFTILNKDFESKRKVFYWLLVNS